jgi:hypothetical protein
MSVKKRFFAPSIIKSDDSNYYVMRYFVEEVDENNEPVQSSAMEETDAWLISIDDMTQLHQLLGQYVANQES